MSHTCAGTHQDTSRPQLLHRAYPLIHLSVPNFHALDFFIAHPHWHKHMLKVSARTGFTGHGFTHRLGYGTRSHCHNARCMEGPIA